MPGNGPHNTSVLLFLVSIDSSIFGPFEDGNEQPESLCLSQASAGQLSPHLRKMMKSMMQGQDSPQQAMPVTLEVAPL